MRSRGWRAGVMGAAFGIAAVGCSSDPEASVPTVELSTTTVTTLPPTTATETTEAPTTTVDPRIAEVEAAVAAFHEVQLEILLSESEPVDRMSAFADGQVLTSITQNTLRSRAEGSYFEGSIESEPRSTSLVSATAATHTACTLDAIAQLASDGSVVVPADSVPSTWTYELAFSAGSWRVIAISIGDSCVAS